MVSTNVPEVIESFRASCNGIGMFIYNVWPFEVRDEGHTWFGPRDWLRMFSVYKGLWKAHKSPQQQHINIGNPLDTPTKVHEIQRVVKTPWLSKLPPEVDPPSGKESDAFQRPPSVGRSPASDSEGGGAMNFEGWASSGSITRHGHGRR